MKVRCKWAEIGSTIDVEYHDNEWAVPVHDDNKLFEFLLLESAQAGLSWSTILKKERLTGRRLTILTFRRSRDMTKKSSNNFSRIPP